MMEQVEELRRKVTYKPVYFVLESSTAFSQCIEAWAYVCSMALGVLSTTSILLLLYTHDRAVGLLNVL
jgi:hypothetical protein